MLVKLKDRDGNSLTREVNDRIRFMHLNGRRNDCGGVTVLCHDGAKQEEYAFAFCSPRDNYDRARGRFEALEKFEDSDPLFDEDPDYTMTPRPIGVLCPETYPERFQPWLVSQIMKQASRCRARTYRGTLFAACLVPRFPEACLLWLDQHCGGLPWEEWCSAHDLALETLAGSKR